jgi:thiamine-monophosphate kinase
VTEDEFIALLRPLAGEAARDLRDDAAVLGDLVFTHDMIVEGVHFRSEDAAADVAWKLVAVNLSDLAAKGAVPVGVLLGYPLGDDAWDRGFAAGLAEVLAAFDCQLLGGDAIKANGPRNLSLTAIGRAAVAPSRAGARDGDELWVTGIIGLAGQGLRGQGGEVAAQAYLRPQPRLAEGQKLGLLVTAMMDVSDGVLIDAGRMAAASGVAIEIALDAVPVAGDALTAVTAGDDYELLFTLPPGTACPIHATRIGTISAGAGITLTQHGEAMPLPERLGYLHA